MTVQDLIKLLEQQDPNMEVRVSTPSHDYWRTQLATEISTAHVELVKYSDYHQKDAIADEDSDVEDCKEVVVLF